MRYPLARTIDQLPCFPGESIYAELEDTGKQEWVLIFTILFQHLVNCFVAFFSTGVLSDAKIVVEILMLGEY